MQDRRLTAAEAAIALALAQAQAYAIGELSEPPDNMPAWDVVAPRRQAGCAEEAAAGLNSTPSTSEHLFARNPVERNRATSPS
jgi:hypothetical protein